MFYGFWFPQDEEEQIPSVLWEKQEIKMLLRQREAEVKYPTANKSQCVQHSHRCDHTDLSITLLVS